MKMDLAVLEEDLIYPGHPMVLAYLIVRRYPTYQAAMERKDCGPPAALQDPDIPGSGGHIWTALECLELLHTVPVDTVWKYANQSWQQLCSNSYRIIIPAGQAQADAIREKLLSNLVAKKWLNKNG